MLDGLYKALDLQCGHGGVRVQCHVGLLRVDALLITTEGLAVLLAFESIVSHDATPLPQLALLHHPEQKGRNMFILRDFLIGMVILFLDLGYAVLLVFESIVSHYATPLPQLALLHQPEQQFFFGRTPHQSRTCSFYEIFDLGSKKNWPRQCSF
jgi:hypothetical protein